MEAHLPPLYNPPGLSSAGSPHAHALPLVRSEEVQVGLVRVRAQARVDHGLGGAHAASLDPRLLRAILLRASPLVVVGGVLGEDVGVVLATRVGEGGVVLPLVHAFLLGVEDGQSGDVHVDRFLLFDTGKVCHVPAHLLVFDVGVEKGTESRRLIVSGGELEGGDVHGVGLLGLGDFVGTRVLGDVEVNVVGVDLEVRLPDFLHVLQLLVQVLVWQFLADSPVVLLELEFALHDFHDVHLLLHGVDLQLRPRLLIRGPDELVEVLHFDPEQGCLLGEALD